MQRLFAGIAIVDITPAKGLELAGYPHFPRHNSGAHDPLYASCMFLQNEETSLAMVGLDILFFSKKHVLEIRRRVAAQTGMIENNIMISCSHSHSTPWASGRLDMDAMLAGTKQDENLIRELTEKISEVIISASRTTFPCEIGFAKEYCGKEQGVGGNRRDPKNGPADPYVYVVSVKDEGGDVRGIFANYAVHPTLLHADNTLCSADYPGYLREYLKKQYPLAHMIFALGASGDQSTRYFRDGQTFAEAKRYGYTLGEAAEKAISKTHYAKDAKLAAKNASFSPTMRDFPPKAEAEKRLEECKKNYDRLVAAKADYIDIQNANVTLLGAEDILGYILMHEKGMKIELVEDELPAVVNLFEIGDVRIASMPGEVFVGIAHLLREKTGDENLIINTVTNGGLPGYVYTKEDVEIGGYEVDTSMMDENAGYEMVDLITNLYKA